MNRETRTAIFARLRDANPEPTTELVWHSPFELLIAVLLSAQATDVSVNKATAKLFAQANTPEGLLELGLDAVRDAIKTIGLYNTKADNVMATCVQLLERHGGQVPRQREALEALPGVAAKRPMWFSIPPLVNSPWQSIPTFFGSVTARVLRPERPFAQWKID